MIRHGTAACRFRFTGGFGRNRLSRLGTLHLTGGRASCSILDIVPPLHQYYAFLCRPACLAPLTPTAIGGHAGTGPRQAPDLFQRDHARSPALVPTSALIGAEEAQADRRPHEPLKDNSTLVRRTRAPGWAGPRRRDQRSPKSANCLLDSIETACVPTDHFADFAPEFENAHRAIRLHSVFCFPPRR